MSQKNMSESAMIVSSVLSDFFEQNNQASSVAMIRSSCKVLRTLLQNAIKETTNPEKLDMYRKVRLSNAKIRERIVRVPGALDILGLAGFSTNGEFLVYTPSENGRELVHTICNGLDTKIQELEANEKKKKCSSNNTTDSPFLSEEDRLKRQQQAKAARMAREAERAATQRRWNEDNVERKAAAKRREAKLLQAPPEGLATGITIRNNSREPMPLATPMEPATARHGLQLDQAGSSDTKVQAKVPSSTLVQDEKGPADSNQKIAAHDAMDAENETIPEEEDRKPAAKPPVEFLKNDESWTWEACMERLPRCASAEGIGDSSSFRKQQLGNAQPMCLKKLFKELDGLSQSLPSNPNCSIWIRFDEETPQYLRALIAAPLPGPTPYSGGLFCFDMYVPDTYPQVPPKVVLLTTGGGRVRFGPNLYADGKVCLSLLGTWPGPKWSPQHSSLYQVLISIQGLILGVEHPYYLEPGHGGWEGRVKEGDFQLQGQTLAGAVVKEEMGVPQEVVQYEDVLRVGTVKYGMLEALSGARHLKPFLKPINAHFYQNRSAIVGEVRHWLSDTAFGRERVAGTVSSSIDELKKLLPKLEDHLSRIVAPNPEGDDGGTDPKSGQSDGLEVAAAQPAENEGECAMGEAQVENTEGEPDVLEVKRNWMKEAAAKGDYVLAGQIQEELQRLVEIQRQMKEAAAEHDFIRAGRLQEQFQALTALDTAPTQNADLQGAATAWHQGSDNPQLHDHDVFDSDAESLDDGTMGMPPHSGMPHHNVGHPHPPMGLGNKVFAPPGYQSHMASRHHQWGTGIHLGSKAPAPATQLASASPPISESAPVPSMTPIPRDQLCRLRIRLPGDKSVVEDFDRNDPLSAVYRRLESLVSNENHGHGNPLQPQVARAGAFSQPLSSAGYTLLLARPKREFSLEVNGTKRLLELNLAPSATLTVMKCTDRGIVHRGELESRLRQAQGNAMELEGLTYEGLMELTERVGVAAPPDGTAFMNISEEDLGQNSKVMSPSAYLASLDATMDNGDQDDEDERRCPICLGGYDPTDTTETLRQLNSCGHAFHSACLATWLRTKSSCPLCKTSVVH